MEQVDKTTIIMVKLRDTGMPTYTYFYINEKTNSIVSPFFDSEQECQSWLNERLTAYDAG